MNPAEIEQIVQTMRRLGVLHMKTADLDITLSESALTLEPRTAPEEEQRARQKIDELKSLFQMSDSELLDRLFPTEKPANEGE